ncbi:hypothetical protein E2C01_066012 [Portunus trituberculatus]|uniref:Uncharacterized protein n=1 Tax=Portunus trituberculatus TaxID=210409 RepID=A0A5B7HP58_PORTR|nr:hypothetical protein [Portunus trituberculatus]
MEEDAILLRIPRDNIAIPLVVIKARWYLDKSSAHQLERDTKFSERSKGYRLFLPPDTTIPVPDILGTSSPVSAPVTPTPAAPHPFHQSLRPTPLQFRPALPYFLWFCMFLGVFKAPGVGGRGREGFGREKWNVRVKTGEEE